MLEIVELKPDLTAKLTEFFGRITADPATVHFHPHELTGKEAECRCSYAGLDHYAVLIHENAISAYGMLRGWDRGYEIPSLGICVLPSDRGRGFGQLMMNYLHIVALCKGATFVRLKVHPANPNAVRLYKRLGYQFLSELEAGQLVGYWPALPPLSNLR